VLPQLLLLRLLHVLPQLLLLHLLQVGPGWSWGNPAGGRSCWSLVWGPPDGGDSAWQRDYCAGCDRHPHSPPLLLLLPLQLLLV
jgi:hypothetical protein